MYEERRYSFDWRGFFIKLIILLLIVFGIFVVLKIFPLPTKNALYDQVYNDNITSMKDAAKSYYTVDRLPKNIGDEETMTLQDMLNNKMITEFVDKDGNYCDTFGSYVTVVKTKADEYSLKVQLACGDHIDYILETIGCYNVCAEKCCGNCEVEIEKVTEYEFKKPTTTIKQVKGCKSGYKLSGNACYKTIKSNYVNATKEYYDKGTSVTDAKISTESSYKQYTGKLTTSKKEYTDKIVTAEKTYIEKITTPGTSSTSCPAGYSLNANKTSCSKSVAHTGTNPQICTRVYAGMQAYKPCSSCSTTYRAIYTNSCSGGGSYTYYTTENASVIVNTTPPTYSCPSGYTEEGSGASLKCYKNVDIYSCPANYTEEGKLDETLKCYKDVNVYSCPAGFTEEGKDENLQCYKTIEGKNNEYCSDFGAILKDHKCYKETEGGFKGYTCPNGYILDGSKCYKKSTDKTNTIMINKKTTTYEYKWSKETAIEGWTKTGNTRLVDATTGDAIKTEETIAREEADKIVNELREESNQEVNERVNNVTANESTKKIDTTNLIIIILIVIGFLYLFWMFLSTRIVTTRREN